MRMWILRATVAAVLALGAVGAAVAQEPGSVLGRVLSSEGRPLAGAQITVDGTDIGVLSRGDGAYTLGSVPAGEQTISAELIGHTTVELTVTVTAGGSVTLDFTLISEPILVDEIVVAALGIERDRRSMGYAIQSVGSEEIERSPEVNLIQALQGQTAGVQVIQSSGRPGASSRIEIRGQSSFMGSGQPLVIVDGMPVITDLDPDEREVLFYGEAGNRAMDLDLSTAEEITILRGAAATALYGSRAAAGAVVIKTREGGLGQPLRMQVSTAMTFDEPITEGYVTDWAAGRDGYFCDGVPASDGGYCQPGYPVPGGFEFLPISNLGYPNWGPHKGEIPAEVVSAVGPIRFEDARDQFYRTARSLNNSIRATGGIGTQGAFAFGASYLDQEGVDPIGKLERLNLSANVTLHLSQKLRSKTSLQRTSTSNPWTNESWMSIHRDVLGVPPSVDIRTAYHEDGSPVRWDFNLPHFQWRAENEYDDSQVERWLVAQRFELDLVPGLVLSNTLGMDSYLDERRRYENERPWLTEAGFPSGATLQQKLTRSQVNNDLVLSLDPRPLGQSGLMLSGFVGGNVFATERSMVAAAGGVIAIPDFYNLGNFQLQEVRADLPEQLRLVGLYGQATLDYRAWAYLTVTGRNDWSSTLPSNANSYFYPSAALGLIFTDALGLESGWLDYGKIRFSYAKVGNDAPPYSLRSTYTTAGVPGARAGVYQVAPTTITFPAYGDQVGYFQANQLGNPDLKPESSREVEAGLELRMLDERVWLDISFYDKRSYDQIFSVPASASSGFSNTFRNAGDLRNKGWEVTALGRLVDTDDVGWDVSANWTRNRSTVVELAGGVENLYLAGYAFPSIRLVEGMPYGVIWGYGFQRNCVEATSDICFDDQPVGALLTGETACLSDLGGTCAGLPLRTQSQIPLASGPPNWLANFGTQVRFKNFGASALLDIRDGGNILNFELQYTAQTGRHIVTSDRGETTVVEGINRETGEPNTVEWVKGPEYYAKTYGSNRHENQIEPAGFVKLRQVSLWYDLPESLTRQVGTDSARFYVVGRNLGIWSDFSMLDPESDIYGGVNGGGQYFRQFPSPQTRGITFGLRASF